MQKIVEPKYLSRIPNEKLQDFKFNDYIIPLASIDFGYEFNTFLATCKLTKDQVMYIKERCKTFAVDLITEVQARLPDNVDTLLMFKCLHPNVVLSGKESISKIGDRYRNVIEDMDELENEWSSLTLDEWPQTSKANIVPFLGRNMGKEKLCRRESVSKCNIIGFGFTVSSLLKCIGGKSLFQNEQHSFKVTKSTTCQVS